MASSLTPSAPTLSEDALPSYEEAILIDTPLNPAGGSYHSLPRSRADTGNCSSLPQKYPLGDEEEDAETALLKAELQRLRQENIEAKKQLLRQEIEKERNKRDSSHDVSNYGSYPTPSTSYPQPPAVTSVGQVPEPVGETQEPTEHENKENSNYGAVMCVFLTVCSTILMGVLIFLFA